MWCKVALHLITTKRPQLKEMIPIESYATQEGMKCIDQVNTIHEIMTACKFIKFSLSLTRIHSPLQSNLVPVYS